MRKPLGRLAVAVLASIAIPLAIAPIASAAGPVLATSSASVSSYKDNVATGVALLESKGLLRIASSNGKPTNITSTDFDVVDIFQAEEDGRFWDVTVKMKGDKSFNKDKISASWHCPGHQPKPTKTTTHKPTSDKPTTSHPTKTETTKPTTPAPTSETTPAPTSDATSPTVAPTEVPPAPGGGDVVNAPVTPSAPAGGSAPQVPFTPVAGVETGYGFLAS